MKAPSPNRECPAAIHRWFAGGEGWAYHPDLAGSIRELADAVKPELQNRTPRIEKRWLQGWVFGCQVADDECPDHHARTRSPTVTRIVSLPNAPATSSREMILRRLSQLTVQEPGVDRALSIQVAPTELDLAGGGGKSRFWIGVWCVAMAVVILLVVSLLVLVDPQQHGSSDANAGKYIDTKIRNLLEGWNIALPRDAFPSNVRQQFFRKLSQLDFDDSDNDHDQQLEESVQSRLFNAEHPDAIFLARLPQRAPEGLPETHKLVDQLFPHLWNLADAVLIDQDASILGTSDTRDAKWKHFPQLFQVIGDGMDYRKWFAANQSHHDPFSAVKPPENIRKRVVKHFLTGDQRIAGVSRDDVRTMVRQLEKWGFEGVEEHDATDRPWFVCFWYLAVLSQPHFGQAAPEPSWYDYFVSRLPEEPSMNPAVRDSSKRFREGALLPLAWGLGIDAPSTVLTSTLLTDIEEAMDYDAWLRRCEKQRDEFVESADVRFRKDGDDEAMRRREIPPFGQVSVRLVRGQEPDVDWTNTNEQSEDERVRDFVGRFRSSESGGNGKSQPAR